MVGHYMKSLTEPISCNKNIISFFFVTKKQMLLNILVDMVSYIYETGVL